MKKHLNSIVVFCGSKSGHDLVYTEASRELGKYLANNEIQLVYGGSKTGLMGELARTCLEYGGKVIGVIPDFMTNQERVLEDVTKLILVDSLQERKLKMEELSDGCITLPGGFGTLDELFEMLTWCQLGLHGKPIGLWNVNKYYNHLIAMVEEMTRSGYLSGAMNNTLIRSEKLEDLVAKMESTVAG